MSNELLKFMNTTTSNIQEALGRSTTKTKKVNHRKYLEKRLQNRGPRQAKNDKKAKLTSSSRQPIAGGISSSGARCLKQSITNEYDQLYQIVSQPSTVFSSTSQLTYSRPPSVHDIHDAGEAALAAASCDPEIESLLSEFGVDSPSQCSLYSDSYSRGTSSRGSLVSSMCSSTSLSLDHGNTVTGDWYAYSPPSDFSDFEDSSPPNSSPAYYPAVSPSPPAMYYHQNLTASYDCIPTTGPLALERPNGLNLPYNPSITELIAELVSTP